MGVRAFLVSILQVVTRSMRCRADEAVDLRTPCSSVCKHTHTERDTYIYACMCIFYVYVCMCIYICDYICIYGQTQLEHTYTYTFVYMYSTYIYIHIHV